MEAKEVPQVLVEVKQCVGKQSQTDEKHLTQMLVQGYYAMIQNSLTHIVVGLCDQAQFHFFGLSLVKKTESSPIIPLMNVKWIASPNGREHIIDTLAQCLAWLNELED